MEKKNVILETERLYLRRLEPGDFDALCAMMQDGEVMYAYNGPFSAEEVRAWLDKQMKRYDERGFGLWAVILKKTGELAGQCGLFLQKWKDREVLEVGYMFHKAHWHKGYATEAAQACKEYAFDTLGAEEVYSIIRDTNLPSQNVARRNGMTPVDTWVKHYRGVDMPHILFCAKKEK